LGLQPAAWPSGRGRGASEPLLPPPAFRAAAASLRGLLGGGGPGEEEGGAAPPHQRELEGWVRRGYPAALDAIRQTRLCPREGRIAGRAAIAGAEALGDWLAGVGYSVELRVARGGGRAGGGVRNLRNAYLYVTGRGGRAWRRGDALAVDGDFREHFVIAKPSPRYERLLGLVPDHFVGPLDSLVDAVHTLCDAARDSFEENGLALPVWRQPKGMLSKWLAPDLETVDLSEAVGALGASVGGDSAASWGGASSLGASPPDMPSRFERMMSLAGRGLEDAPRGGAAPSAPRAAPRAADSHGSLPGDGCAFLEEQPGQGGSGADFSFPAALPRGGGSSGGGGADAKDPPADAAAAAAAAVAAAELSPGPQAARGLHRSASANALLHAGAADSPGRAMLSPPVQRANTFKASVVRVLRV